MTKKNIDDLTPEELNEMIDKVSDDMLADSDDEDSSDVVEAIIYRDKEERFEIVNDDEDLDPEEKKKRDKARAKIIKMKEREIKKSRKKNSKVDIDRFTPNLETGLTTDLVEERILDGLVNDNNTKTGKSIFQIIIGKIFTIFNIMIFLIAAALIFVGAYTDLVFLFIVIINISIGIYQEIKAKKMIDSLSLMSAPTAIVRRGGVNREVSVKEVVLDEIILLESGRQICADSIVVDGSIEVNESLLTGESDAIVKNVGDVLYSGSFVVSGKCYARVDKIGKDNYIEKISAQAKKLKNTKSDLLVSLNWIIKIMIIPVVICGIGIFLMNYQLDNTLKDTIRVTAGAMIGMIPSGLFLMSSIALFVGVVRLGQKNVLVQELYCIEMLARVNCICLDKTGTITDGTMVVKNVIDYNTVSGLATKNIVSAILNALQDNNLTSQALKDKFGLGKRMKHTAAIPFSSQRKYQAVTFDKYGTFILGAPEFVLLDDFKKYKKDVEKYAALGYRVLCLAHKNGEIIDGNLPSGEITIVSMILIEDNIRPDAINTIKYFRESGVQVKVISGDNPITVSKISQRAGVENADHYISLEGLSDSEVKSAATRYTVFGRVSPAQKKLLIRTLKSEGLTVAMTGDGVNDILALREADCSIAVASGSDAAVSCAHLVLVDSNFDSMPYVVAEGRRVINNVTSVASLFLTKTIFSLFLAIQALLNNGSYPIQTNQLILIELLAIGIPSLVLVNEPNNNPVSGKFLVNVVKKALPGALVILLMSIVVFNLSESMYLDKLSRNTIIIIAATHTCLMVLFKACRPFNTIRKVLCAFCYTMFIVAIAVLPSLLEIKPIVSFAEYYSENIETTIVKKYPSIERSSSDYYVINDIVTNIEKSSQFQDNKSLTASYDATSGKTYYAINDKILDLEVTIPNLSFNNKGEIFIGGYRVDSSIKWNDDINKKIYLDKNGNLFYKSSDTVSKPVKIILTRNNKKYDFNIKYGDYNESNSIFQYNLLPTVEIKHGAYVINGVQSQNELYKVPSSYIPSDVLDIKVELQATDDYRYYNLLINGSPIYATYQDGSLATTPYQVKLPEFTTVLNKSNDVGVLYLDSVSTGMNIFEIYGMENEELDLETQTTYKTYSIKYKDESNNVIPLTYSELNGNIFVNDIYDPNFTFIGLKYQGFKNYLDVDGVPIDVYNQSKPLSVVVQPSESIYSLLYNEKYYKMDTIASINNSQFAPEIAVTEEGKCIINGYYTDYDYPDYNLDPRIGKGNLLVVGGITTDFEINSNDIITVTGGIVKKLSVANEIFLLMLCLASAPIMKLLQYAIPWISKQTKQIAKLLGKY